MNKASEILSRAASLVAEDREQQHGNKARNFGNIAMLWNAYLTVRVDPVAPLTAIDVGHMMVLLKVARTQLGSLNIDDYIDMAGYGGCAGQIAIEEAENDKSEG